MNNLFVDYFTFTNSTSKISQAFGGITPPAPLAPYPKSGGIRKVAESPSLRRRIPSSQPLMTCPTPTGNSIG